MRYARQNKVLELIESYEIQTQEKLCELLKKSGYDVTQATVSRDVKELQLVKTLSDSGKYRYAQTIDGDSMNNRFANIFRETIKSIDYSGNIIVVKTLTGCGNAAGEAIDSLKFPNVIGSVAGDNTILVVVNSDKNALPLVEEFNGLLK